MWGNGGFPLLGHIQEFKVYVGDNPYTADFTPATASSVKTISNSGTTSVLDDAGAAAVRRVVAVTRGNNAARAFVTTTDSSGDYSLSVPEEAEFNVICEDNAAGTEYSDILVSHVTPT
jgi:hypothetical protein